jgi:hypothetical protein
MISDYLNKLKSNISQELLDFVHDQDIENGENSTIRDLSQNDVLPVCQHQGGLVTVVPLQPHLTNTKPSVEPIKLPATTVGHINLKDYLTKGAADAASNTNDDSDQLYGQSAF